MPDARAGGAELGEDHRNAAADRMACAKHRLRAHEQTFPASGLPRSDLGTPAAHFDPGIAGSMQHGVASGGTTVFQADA